MFDFHFRINCVYVCMNGLPCGGSDGKVSACNAGDLGSIPGFDPWVWKIFLEKEMGSHSSTFAWKISWMEEPGRLQFMGLQRVGHD